METTETLDLKLRIAVGAAGDYDITITLAGVGIQVTTHSRDLRAGVYSAAQQATQKLTDQGFVVTVDQVIAALETALENSVSVPIPDGTMLVPPNKTNKDMN